MQSSRRLASSWLKDDAADVNRMNTVGLDVECIRFKESWLPIRVTSSSTSAAFRPCAFLCNRIRIPVIFFVPSFVFSTENTESDTIFSRVHTTKRFRMASTLHEYVNWKKNTYTRVPNCIHTTQATPYDSMNHSMLRISLGKVCID